jgi:hypothetical protein
MAVKALQLALSYLPVVPVLFFTCNISKYIHPLFFDPASQAFSAVRHDESIKTRDNN